jgi:hypothetical protein
VRAQKGNEGLFLSYQTSLDRFPKDHIARLAEAHTQVGAGSNQGVAADHGNHHHAP